MKGICGAITVINWTFASSGNLAMCKTEDATCFTSIVASLRMLPSGCGMPVVIARAMSVSALPTSICDAQMLYNRPSSDKLLVNPVTACFVLVYGADPGRGA